jgi:ribosomal protein L37AE/L43A
MAGQRRCRACKQIKPTTQFRRGGFGLLWTCKACQRKSGQGGKFIAPKVRVVRR